MLIHMQQTWYLIKVIWVPAYFFSYIVLNTRCVKRWYFLSLVFKIEPQPYFRQCPSGASTISRIFFSKLRCAENNKILMTTCG